MKDKKGEFDPRIKDVLKLLGLGTLLTAAILLPGLGVLARDYWRMQRAGERKEWEKFNFGRLRQVLKRLEKQKIVEAMDGIIKITEKGKQKLLKYDLEDMKLEEKTDGKWRIIIYDIANLKKPQRELFRRALKKLNFLPIQKSVYLIPFICENEIEYLRQFFHIAKDVIVLKVSEFENDKAYRKYFGI